MTSTISTSHDTSTPTEPLPLNAAKPSVSTGLLPLLGTVLAIGVIALGVVGVREGLVHSGAVSGELWFDRSATYLDDKRPESWFYPVGALVVLVGVGLVLMALRPRSRKEVPLKANTGIFISKGSVQRLAESAASNVDGIDTVTASASSSRVTVDATTVTTDHADTRSRVESAVSHALSALEKPPTIRVRLENTGGAS